MSLPAEVEELIASLKRQIAALQAEVADLRRQLGQDSSNSSKPPSRRWVEEEASYRGQACAAARARRAAGKRAIRAARCGKSPIPIMWLGTRRAPAAIAVRRSNRGRRSGSRSAKCSTFPSVRSWLRNIRRRSTSARIAAARRRRRFPRAWSRPPQYGERIKAAAIYLNIQQLIPEDRTAQALSDLFGAPLDLPGQHRGLGSKEGGRPAAGPCAHPASAWPK